jgi:hypothetical protein
LWICDNRGTNTKSTEEDHCHKGNLSFLNRKETADMNGNRLRKGYSSQKKALEKEKMDGEVKAVQKERVYRAIGRMNNRDFKG